MLLLLSSYRAADAPIFLATRYESGMAAAKPIRTANGMFFIASAAREGTARTEITALPASAVPNIIQTRSEILNIGVFSDFGWTHSRRISMTRIDPQQIASNDIGCLVGDRLIHINDGVSIIL